MTKDKIIALARMRWPAVLPFPRWHEDAADFCMEIIEAREQELDRIKSDAYDAGLANGAAAGRKEAAAVMRSYADWLDKLSLLRRAPFGEVRNPSSATQTAKDSP